MNKETKDRLNFIHNTLGITKDELKAAILDEARQVGKREAQRLLQQGNNEVLAVAVRKAVEDGMARMGSRFDGNSLGNLVSAHIAKIVMEHLTITIKQ